MVHKKAGSLQGADKLAWSNNRKAIHSCLDGHRNRLLDDVARGQWIFWWDRQFVFGQAFEISADGIGRHVPRFFQCVPFGYQPARTGT